MLIVTSFDDPSFTGDRWARRYPDGDLTGGPDPAAAVDFLAELAGAGARVLELAIGGGRVARPLMRRGYRVEGVEASAAVAQRLAASPDGPSIPVVVADMADVPVSGTFGLVYVVWNSLFNLTTQARQVDCFRNVARVLEPGGTFVLECFVPDLAAYDRQVTVGDLTEDSALLSIVRHDRPEQRITKQLVTIAEQGIRLLSVRQRYSWPSELDLMAQLAGLRLRERHADWVRTPFGAASTDHISIYERP
jgi:SAM-dependent methyltransferase